MLRCATPVSKVAIWCARQVELVKKAACQMLLFPDAQLLQPYCSPSVQMHSETFTVDHKSNWG